MEKIYSFINYGWKNQGISMVEATISRPILIHGFPGHGKTEVVNSGAGQGLGLVWVKGFGGFELDV